MERIKDEGMLVVITRNSSTTYYEDKDGFKGFEYELVKQFADELGVVIRFVIPDRFEYILPMIARGEAHFAAAGLTVTDRRSSFVRFTPSYQQITQQLVYRARNKRPKKITDTGDGVFEIVAGSSHEEELQRLKSQFPDLNWISQRNLESEELLYLVWEQVIDYTIADSNEL
ncbi:MAG: transporter substrate-binding domain-containing protein, partial [Gammaproteobacteria bacterium]|nr:transporter substrate-binding domain-containing protein [Gammaproteobacteria bacterium]